jgi:Tol biopolymer transport system component
MGMLTKLRVLLESAHPIFAAGVFLAACASDAEQLGTPVTPAGDVRADCELTWSADASEIYYLASSLTGPTSLRAAKTDGSAVRTVDASKAEYWTLVMPHDRSSLYYTALESGRSTRALYEAFHPREITGLVPDNKADVIEPAPDDRHLAFWSSGALQYFDTSDASSILLAEGTPNVGGTAGNHDVLTFSPAGDKLFFLVIDNNRRYSADVVDLASAKVEPITLAGGLWPAVSWGEGGIRILWASSSLGTARYQVENVPTGEVETIWEAPRGDMSTRNAWSPDGDHVAIWAGKCVEFGSSIDSCGKYVADLFVIDAKTHSASTVAHTIGGVGTMAFAPDGHRLAYVTHQRIYVSDVP